MSLWLMANEQLAEIKKLEEVALSTSAMTADNEFVKPVKNCVAEFETYNEMRLHGPLIARADWITSYLGINSTEQYMSELDRLLQTGKPLNLDIDGPGGQVSLLMEFTDQIYEAGDQITAHVSGMAASAHMLAFLAVQGGRTAHYQATLGSMGVIGSVPYKFSDQVISKRAKNKRPEKKAVQKRIDRVEQKYLENASKYTGMSFDDVVKGSDEGAVFSGEEGLQRGFVEELSTYKTNSERLNMSPTPKPSQEKPSNEGATFSQEDVNAEVAKAVQGRDARWQKMLEHPKASANIKAVIHHAMMPVDDEQALGAMEFVSGEAPAAPAAPAASAPAGEPAAPAAPAADPVAEAEIEKIAAAAAAAAVKQVRASAGTPVPPGNDDGASGEGEADEPPKTQAEKDKASVDAGASALERIEARR